jgi:hypothetical protein
MYVDVDYGNIKQSRGESMNASMTLQTTAAVRKSGEFGLRGALPLLWRTDPVLTATGLVLLAALVPSVAGVWLDPRAITNAPAWLKPAKFALSTAIYSLTLAWVFSYLPEWPRMRRFVGRTTAVVLLLEVAIIDLQAWRGTTSHFNVGTSLDATLFGVMGTAIFIQTISSIAVAVALWRHRFADRTMGWALRLGMTLTICGAFVGGLMTTGPTEAQLADAQVTGRIATAGAHTVGGPDGGSGLPITGWSTQHGDLRVPHFVGLHAVQALPLTALLLRRRGEASRVRGVTTLAAVYALTFAALVVQAVMGVPIIPWSR